ncbi:hypothetical protein D9M68_591420 [compost metagenome]
MGDHQLVRHAIGDAEAGAGLGTRQVLHGHRLARAQGAGFHQREPRREAGAGQRAGFLEAQRGGRGHGPVRIDAHVRGQHARPGAAEQRGVGVPVAVGPAAPEGVDHAVAHGKAMYARAHGHHRARHVRAGREGQVERHAHAVAHHEQVAVVERHRAHAHEDLARARRGHRRLGLFKVGAAQSGKLPAAQHIGFLHRKRLHRKRSASMLLTMKTIRWWIIFRRMVLESIQ